MLRTLTVTALLAAGAAFPQVVSVSIDRVVHPISAEILEHAIQEAHRTRAAVLLLRLNTPGGLLEATREATEKIVASPVPVVTYVAPSGGRAASAGFFLLMAGDVAAMAPGTNTGAASPILLGQEMDPVLRKKAENDAAAALRSMVEKRGRNSALAEKAVLEAKAFTEKEALEQNLIEIVAPDEKTLIEKLDGREITRLDGRKQTLKLASFAVRPYELTLKESVMSALSDPNLAFILLTLGALGIYVEFSAPGLIVPGVAGGILVLLGLSALAILPIHWGGAALLILALVLFILEAKFASHGVIGTGGAIAMVLGAVLLVDAPPEMRIQWPVAISVTLPFALITMFLVTLVIRARASKVATGEESMVGRWGVASTDLRPLGQIFFDGTYWQAKAISPVASGAPVKVIGVDGLTLTVEPGTVEGGPHA
ncbi:MAG: nodulation protein NfeD [Acidimicrobiia bacterium]|nr:nodulation protein NfeD [Acidimicrobiia bacterium]